MLISSSREVPIRPWSNIVVYLTGLGPRLVVSGGSVGYLKSSSCLKAGPEAARKYEFSDHILEVVAINYPLEVKRIIPV